VTKPILIVTRPSPQGQSFARDVVRGLENAIDVILSPQQMIQPVEVGQIPSADQYIFTSAHGVTRAQRLGLTGKRAWWVGERTAHLAREAGFDAVAAGGSQQDLFGLIHASKPKGKILHLSGVHVQGDLVEKLSELGCDVQRIVVYDQVEIPLTQQAIDAFQGERPVVLPLFSPRSARMLVRAVEMTAPVNIVAISAAVAQEARDLPVQQVVVAEWPDGPSMIRATRSEIGRFVPEERR
jgi:uroporphyrinogen-III synthase